MVAFLNTVGDVDFYNFISNKYPAGIPFRWVRSVESTHYNPLWWLARNVWSSTQANMSGNDDGDIYIWFPSVASTPTENETNTSSANTSSRYRWYIRSDSKYGIGIDNDDRVRITWHDTNTSARSHEFVIGNQSARADINNSAEGEQLENYFSFACASPSTFVYSTFITDTEDNPRLNTNYEYNCTLIIGWAHDSVFPSPPVDENTRYNAVYCLRINTSLTNPVICEHEIRRPIDKTQSNNNTQDMIPSYFPIACQSGSYSLGTFLTDLILHDDNGTQVGKVDNRVACIGRGNFEKGKVYQVNNVFGRTGNEEWLCTGPYVVDVVLPNWEPGDDVTSDNKFQNAVWPVGEEDYLMIRIYTEADGA